MTLSGLERWILQIRQGAKPSQDLIESVSLEIKGVQSALNEVDLLEKRVVSSLVFFVYLEPSNKYQKYNEEDFDRIYDFWEEQVGLIIDALEG